MVRLGAGLFLFLLIGVPDLRADEPSLDGRWSGRWSSESSGHSGPLRAKFTRTAAGDYRVVFSGRFLKVVPFRYAQTLHVTGTDGEVLYLHGSSRLLGFGTFTYSAAATGTSFHSTFQSRGDRGTFILNR